MVPGPWQAQFDDLRSYSGAARYATQVLVPNEWQERIRLCFGAVDYRAEVRVNGAVVGTHVGGYLPFAMEIQDCVEPGQLASLEVDVVDTMSSDALIGKQRWYGPIGGLWQSAHLESFPNDYVESMRIEADASTGRVTVRPRVPHAQSGLSYRLSVVAPDGETFEGDGTTVTVPDPMLWELDAPALYGCRLSLARGGETCDVISDTFGFRTIEARDGRVWLNGRALYLAGALDQDYYPEMIYTPPSDEFLRRQIAQAKDIGLNLLRCHIKIPDPRYLEWADRLGMLVWQELPSWWASSESAKGEARRTLEGMIERDFNHPSICAWSIANEGWGLDLEGAQDRAWLVEMFDAARALDPTRIIVDNSACLGNFHVKSDLNDFHYYSAVPDDISAWDDFLTGWCTSPERSYSPHGDAQRRGDEPMILSEFGNWGLPDPGPLRSPAGEDPWWFDSGGDWVEGAVRPKGVDERFEHWRLSEVFGTLRDLAIASQEHQFESIKHLLERIRLRPELAGWVLTELTDVHWECNGIFDMNRTPKARNDEVRSLFAPDLPIAVPALRRIEAGEAIDIDLHIAHASEHDLSSCTLEWRLCDSGGVVEAGMAPWTVAHVGMLSVPVNQPGRHVMRLRLRSGAGELVGENHVEVAAYSPAPAETAVWTEDEDIARFLAVAGYRLEPSAPVTVGTEPAGPTCMVMPPLDREHSVGCRRIVPRRESTWAGDWAQGMHWLTEPLVRDTPLRNRLDVNCIGMVPPAVIDGCDPTDVLAGLYVGWLGRPVATAARLSPGTIVTTFPFLEAGGRDPMARALFRNLLRGVAVAGAA